MPFGGLLTVGIIAAGKLISAKMASNAANKAAKTQVTAANQAKGYAEDRYKVAEGITETNRTAGRHAVNRMSDLLMSGNPPQLPPSATPWHRDPVFHNRPNIQTMGGSPMTGGGGGGGPTMASLVGGQARPMVQQGGPMVTVQAPNGQTRTVSRAEADHYVSRGAQIVG